MKRSSKLVAAAAALGALAIAPSAQAQVQTQDITGAGVNTLSLGAPVGGGVLTPLTPGSTATSLLPAEFAVISPTGPWNLKVREDGGDGHMSAGALGCDDSDPVLDAALDYAGDPVVGASATVNGTLSGGDTLVASDSSLADTVEISYSQDVGATEQIQGLCEYSVTATYTLAAGLP